MNKIPNRKNIFEAFYNKLSKPFTKIFLKTSFSPNIITIFSGTFGLAACYMIVVNSYQSRIIAFLFIQLFALLDLVDGDVARRRNLTSNFGHWLDIFFDKLVEVALIIAFIFASYMSSGELNSIIIGSGLITFHLLIQYIMIINQLYFQKSKRKTSSNIINDLKTKKNIIASSAINTVRFIELHLTLKHSTLLLILSIFVILDQHYFGLCVLLLMSVYTLIFMCIYNFYLIKN